MGTEFQYRRIDVRDTNLLHSTIEAIANTEGRMDGLVAAAGIQQETPALDYTSQDANRMFEVNVTGVMMTAQAVAKQMIRFGNGGSIALIASMSGTVANRVSSLYSVFPGHFPRFTTLLSLVVFRTLANCIPSPGPHLFCLQRQQSCRYPTCPQPRLRVGPVQYPGQHYLSRLYCHCHG